eukprot:5343113-Pyramimonas_sp.AAC.1
MLGGAGGGKWDNNGSGQVGPTGAEGPRLMWLALMAPATVVDRWEGRPCSQLEVAVECYQQVRTHPIIKHSSNITSFYGSCCANNGKDALNTPEIIKRSMQLPIAPNGVYALAIASQSDWSPVGIYLRFLRLIGPPWEYTRAGRQTLAFVTVGGDLDGWER